MDLPAAVLVVDCHRHGLAAIESMLRPVKAELMTASSTGKALKVARRRDFAVIVLGQLTGGRISSKTLKVFRASAATSRTPIVLLGDVDQSRTGELQTIGLVDQMQTSILGDGLRTKVGGLVSLYRRETPSTRRTAGSRNCHSISRVRSWPSRPASTVFRGPR